MKLKLKILFIFIILVIFAVRYLAPVLTLEDIEENGSFFN